MITLYKAIKIEQLCDLIRNKKKTLSNYILMDPWDYGTALTEFP